MTCERGLFVGHANDAGEPLGARTGKAGGVAAHPRPRSSREPQPRQSCREKLFQVPGNGRDRADVPRPGFGRALKVNARPPSSPLDPQAHLTPPFDARTAARSTTPVLACRRASNSRASCATVDHSPAAVAPSNAVAKAASTGSVAVTLATVTVPTIEQLASFSDATCGLKP